MNQPTKEQIQWLWEQCGFRVEHVQRYQDGRWIPEHYEYNWHYPDGGSEFLPPPLDLNNLLKYAVPQLNLPDNELYCVEFTYNKPNGGITCDIKREIDLIQEHGETEALALFWAIYKALGGK